jgi:hypothetical protein
MSYFRSYFNKNNTLIKDSQINTAKNPNTEIFYGSGFSKFIFRVDLTDLKSKIDNGELVLDGTTKHYLHLTNTIFGDEGLMGLKRSTGRERTTSFNLIIFPVTEFWDEGVGFDYEQAYDYTTGNETFDERPSNWFNRTTLDSWSQEGVYSTTPTQTIATAHFDNGNEDLHVDVTDFINEIVTGTTPNYGMGVAFSPAYMDITNPVDQSVAFFTKYTQTFFEPFVETVFEDTIEDNRENFIAEINRNLYLYVTKGTNSYDLDELPIVDILDSSSNPIPSLTGLTTTKIRKGVYKVTFGLTGVLCDGKRFYFDKWKNIKLDGVDFSDVIQKFVPKQHTSLFTIGANQTELERYSVQFFGVKMNEKIKRGDNKKVVVTFRSINQPMSVLFDDVFYRIYIKEGKTNVTVFDWTKLDRTNENSFMLDTSYLIPREYFVEIKAKTHSEEIYYKDEIKFEIISEK